MRRHQPAKSDQDDVIAVKAIITGRRKNTSAASKAEWATAAFPQPSTGNE
jgi:hypothetical protein